MNPLLQVIAGLVLATAPSGASISVEGAVLKAGEFKTSEPVKLRTLIRRAGVREDADRKRVQIIASDGSVETVDATKLETNPQVELGSVVRVPLADPGTHIFISGAVQNRGAMEIRPGLDLATAIAEAGLPAGAGSDRIIISRVDDGKSKVEAYDLDKILGGLQANVLLKPGDKITVPHMRASTTDRELLTIIVIGLLILLLVK